MFPAHAAAKEKAAGDKKEPKYEKVPGTEIQHLKGGVVVRVAMKSGLQFPPDDIEGAKKHVEEIKGENYSKKEKTGNGGGGGGQNWWAGMPGWMQAMLKAKGMGKGKGGGGGGAQKKKKKKELTPEQIEERRKKNEERAAKKLAEENRVIEGNKFYQGEILARSKMCAWVKPKAPNTIPSKVMTKLKQMNEELRTKATEKEGKKSKPFLDGKDDLVVYVRLSDISEEGLECKAGASVQFKLYTDTKGVGGCEVKSA